MEMQVDSKLIRLEREKRAWSQEHLAKLTGLSLRTIQRIETTEMASYVSISAISAVLEIPVADLRVEVPISLKIKAPAHKVEMPAAGPPAPRNRLQLVPYVVAAMGILLATAIAVRTSDSKYLVMAGPLVLALLLVAPISWRSGCRGKSAVRRFRHCSSAQPSWEHAQSWISAIPVKSRR